MVSSISAWNKRQPKRLKYELSVILTPSYEMLAVFLYNKPPACVPAPQSSECVRPTLNGGNKTEHEAHG